MAEERETEQFRMSLVRNKTQRPTSHNEASVKSMALSLGKPKAHSMDSTET